MRAKEKEFSIASHPAKVLGQFELCGEIDWVVGNTQWVWLDLEKGSQCERELSTF